VPRRRTLAKSTNPLRGSVPAALHSLGGNLAFAILAALGFLRRLHGTGNPSLSRDRLKPVLLKLIARQQSRTGFSLS
jgi:hypothetical protein